MNGIKISPQVMMPSFPTEKPKAVSGEQDNFGDFLANAIKGVDDMQLQAADAQDKLVRGEAAELHQVMIAVEKAGISMDLLLEIRRRLLDAYQEITRMPV